MTENSDDQNQWRHDYDQRQYRRMVERLDAFLDGRLHLGGLESDLYTLLVVLEGEVNDSWADKFSELLCELETINAFAIDRGEKEEDTRRAREVAEQLKRMVLPKIESDGSANSVHPNAS